MKSVVTRIGRSVLLPAAAGCVVAIVVSSLFVWYVDRVLIPESLRSGAGREPMQNESVGHYPPPMPVSPPLVRPTVSRVIPSLAPSASSVAQITDLPSFAPLVRQVIPAVVNISISHDTVVPSRSVPRTTSSDTFTKPSSSVVRQPAPASRVTHPVRRHHHSVPHHTFIHHRVRPIDDDMTGAGSGFIVDASGIIVTNRHVVGEATQVMVSLSDGRSLPAKLLGDDPMTDIAVIKVESTTPLPCVQWGDSRQVEIGDWILVAGNPFGFGSSVTAGIVSAVGRDLGIGALDNFMQLDAPINPGNSGGPAFNLRGQVVAVNAAIASPSDGSVGIGFGIPAEIVSPVVAEIEKTGHVEHGWLGVSLNDATSPMWVEDVDRNGAAWEAGLRRGDEILSMGDVPVHDARTVLRSVAAAHPGTVFIFTIRRHGEMRTLSVTLGKRPLADTD